MHDGKISAARAPQGQPGNAGVECQHPSWTKEKESQYFDVLYSSHLTKRQTKRTAVQGGDCRQCSLTVCRVCSDGVLWMRVLGCGLRVGLGEAELTRGPAGRLSCSMLLERPPFTSRPTLFRPMEEKKRRRKSFGRPSSFLHRKLSNLKRML